MFPSILGPPEYLLFIVNGLPSPPSMPEWAHHFILDTPATDGFRSEICLIPSQLALLSLPGCRSPGTGRACRQPSSDVTAVTPDDDCWDDIASESVSRLTSPGTTAVWYRRLRFIAFGIAQCLSFSRRFASWSSGHHAWSHWEQYAWVGLPNAEPFSLDAATLAVYRVYHQDI